MLQEQIKPQFASTMWRQSSPASRSGLESSISYRSSQKVRAIRQKLDQGQYDIAQRLEVTVERLLLEFMT